MKAIQIDDMCPLIQVFDMPTSVRFYTRVLDFELFETSGSGERFDWAWLRRDGVNLMLNTAFEEEHRPAEPDPARWAGHQDTALFFSCPDVDGAYWHLLDHGLEVEPPVVRDYGMRQVYVRDPDGYVICFQWPAEEPAPEEGG